LRLERLCDTRLRGQSPKHQDRGLIDTRLWLEIHSFLGSCRAVVVPFRTEFVAPPKFSEVPVLPKLSGDTFPGGGGGGIGMTASLPPHPFTFARSHVDRGADGLCSPEHRLLRQHQRASRRDLKRLTGGSCLPRNFFRKNFFYRQERKKATPGGLEK